MGAKTRYNYRGDSYTILELSKLKQCTRNYNSLRYCILYTDSKTVTECMESEVGKKSPPGTIGDRAKVLSKRELKEFEEQEADTFASMMEYMKPTSVSFEGS